MKPLSEYPPLMSVKQVAEATGLSVRTVWRKIKAGELRGMKLGKHPTSPVKVARNTVASWLNSSTVRLEDLLLNSHGLKVIDLGDSVAICLPDLPPIGIDRDSSDLLRRWLDSFLQV